MLTCASVTNAHGCSQILCMLQLSPTTFATLALDTHLKIWQHSFSSPHPKLLKTIPIPSSYLHCFSQTSFNTISIGIADGTLLFLDESTFEIVMRVKYHNDLPTGLIEMEEDFVSCGLDGRIVVFGKGDDLGKAKYVLKIGGPVWRIKKFEGDLYVVGGDETSFKIQNFRLSNQSEPIPLSKKFLGYEEYQNQLYCYNETSIIILNSLKTTKITNTINHGCDYLKKHCGKLLAVRQGEIGIFDGQNLDIRWWKVQELQEGYQIRASVEIDGVVYLAGDAGDIYRIEIGKEEQ